MNATNEVDWAYLATLIGLPVLFAAVMVYIYIYTRRRWKSRLPPGERIPKTEPMPRPGPPD